MGAKPKNNPLHWSKFELYLIALPFNPIQIDVPASSRASQSRRHIRLGHFYLPLNNDGPILHHCWGSSSG